MEIVMYLPGITGNRIVSMNYFIHFVIISLLVEMEKFSACFGDSIILKLIRIIFA